ncbi:uncharacterized protein TNIN_61971 [Trichonephila inaurata madagascariensis]|uniref:Uncharacterized protein n=1 Tax=Trichonephila inaurata madagascariensis TaxID=2747483 RepID=A0A8X7BZB8_9ARAC|nr:uncharacterized protein TNIN_61971 [Trichonephila inaurata madagascariensis]
MFLVSLYAFVAVATELCDASKSRQEYSKYELALFDAVPKERYFKTVSGIEELQCASICSSEDECRGFKIEDFYTCSLFSFKMSKNACTNMECIPRPRSKVYKKIPSAMQDNYLETNSVDETKITTSKSISSLANMIGIPVDPYEIDIYKLECGNHFLRGFQTSFLFDGKSMPRVFCDVTYDPYTEGIPTNILRFYHGETAQCKTKQEVIVGVEFQIADDELQTVAVACLRVKKVIDVESESSVRAYSSNKAVKCRQGYLVVGVKATKNGSGYDMQLTCQKF